MADDYMSFIKEVVAGNPARIIKELEFCKK